MQIKTIDSGHRHRRELWLDDDTRVGDLWVIDYTMRIGTAEVRMAGIGGVHTEREHRMKGYMRGLFEETVTYMTDEGYDVSMLFGIANFYNKFGYATCVAQHRFTIKTRDAEAAGASAGARAPSPKARPIESKDMPAIVELYNANNAVRTCSMVRSTEGFTKFEMGTHWGAPVETALWEDDGGELLGYVVWDRDRTSVRVAEVGAADDAVFPTILTTLAQQAVEKRCEEITVFAPPDDPFAEYAQRFGTEWTIRNPRYSDGMLRIMNQRPFFEKLAPELARRLSGFEGAVPIALQTDLGAITLTPESGNVALQDGVAAEAQLALSQDKLMQLILGYRSVRDMLNTPDVTITGDAVPMLQALFPRDTAFMWKPDHF
ncbi:MAG: GNAT family N-acetyltransferase [Anaerolineae bacterium]|nr:GNAT family N-acetyltransferase [Anaerolineae bacterium]